jgi:hypothetical protein
MFLNDMADYLTSAGAFVQATDLFVGSIPPAPDTAVTLYETGGQAPVHAFNASPGQAKVEQPRMQVVSRAASYATARANAQKAFLLLDGLPTRTINGVSYFWGAAVQSPFLMGRDEQNRPMVAFNVDVFKTMSSTS